VVRNGKVDSCAYIIFFMVDDGVNSTLLATSSWPSAQQLLHPAIVASMLRCSSGGLIAFASCPRILLSPLPLPPSPLGSIRLPYLIEPRFRYLAHLDRRGHRY